MHVPLLLLPPFYNLKGIVSGPGKLVETIAIPDIFGIFEGRLSVMHPSSSNWPELRAQKLQIGTEKQ